MLRELCQLILAVFIVILIPLAILVLSPIFVYRYIIAKCVPYLNPSTYGKILTAGSTSMGVDDITSKPMWSLVNRITMTASGGSGFEEFKQQFKERVINFKNEQGELWKPELQQYPSQKFGFLFWKWDKEFRVENHVKQKVDGFEYDVLNKEVSDRIMKSMIYKPFEPNQSPWEVVFLENYQDEDSKAGEARHVLFVRGHHSIADGFSFIKTFLVDFGDSVKLDVAVSKHLKTAANHPPVKNISQQMIRFLTPIITLIRIPYDLAYIVLDIFQYNSNVWHLPENQLKRSLNAAQVVVPIETVKDIKNLYRCSFGTVILAIYTAALRKFMSEAGYTKMPTNILCGMALPVPNHPDHKMRNHASAILARLPIGVSEPMQRIQEIENNQVKLKAGTLSISLFYSAKMTGALFASMVRKMTFNRNTTVVGSIFPGPNRPTPAGKFTFDGMSYAGGFTRGNVALGFSCMSFNSKLNILVGIDDGLVPESTLPATKMVDYMIEELKLLKEAAHSGNHVLDYKFNAGEAAV